MFKVISVAAMIAGLSTAAYAGSNAAAVEEQEVDNVFVAAPSSGGLALPLAIAGGVLAIGLIAGSNDSATATTPGSATN